jgi:predicted Zn-dependent protease with MMP-like domain
MDRARFRRLVQRALRSLPPEVHDALDNVAVVIEREPSAEDLRTSGSRPGDTLFGLYLGTPLTERGSSYGLTLPDRIVIYQGPLERHFHPRDIPEEVTRTVLHELAHHFGFDDDHLDRLGMS